MSFCINGSEDYLKTMEILTRRIIMGRKQSDNILIIKENAVIHSGLF